MTIFKIAVLYGGEAEVRFRRMRERVSMSRYQSYKLAIALKCHRGNL